MLITVMNIESEDSMKKREDLTLTANPCHKRSHIFMEKDVTRIRRRNKGHKVRGEEGH